MALRLGGRKHVDLDNDGCVLRAVKSMSRIIDGFRR